MWDKANRSRKMGRMRLSEKYITTLSVAYAN